MRSQLPLKKILIGLALATLSIPTLVLASGNTYSADTTVSFGSLSLTIQSGSTAESVTVNSTTLTVTTGVGDQFVILSPDVYELTADPAADATDTCTETVSKITVGASKTVTITPTASVCVPPLDTTPPQVDIPATGGGGGALASGAPATGAPVTTVTVNDKSLDALEEGADGLVYNYFSDLEGLSPTSQRNINLVTRWMIKNKTLPPITNAKRFFPTHIATFGQAAQIANSVSPLKCGSAEYLGIHSCYDHAKKMKYVAQNEPINSRVTRLEFYEMMLKALGKKVVKKQDPLAQYARFCSDTEGVSIEEANLYLTARQFKITPRFKNGKCQIHLYFSRNEAMAIAAQVINHYKLRIAQ